MKSTSLQKRQRRIARIRARVIGTQARPRLSVFRSLAHIGAQIINDRTGKTVVAAHDRDLDAAALKGKKKSEVAMLVGSLIAERAKAKGVTTVVFDRRDKKYHGRVKALADAARSGGLIF